MSGVAVAEGGGVAIAVAPAAANPFLHDDDDSVDSIQDGYPAAELEEVDYNNNEVDDDEDDDDDDEEEDDEEDLPLPPLRPTLPPLSRDDPRRMALTDQERQWALAIKEIIQGMPDIDNLSDFMYCQLALVDYGNVEGAVKRAYQMQAFREEYGIMDTEQDGRRFFHGIIKLFPKHMLSVSFSNRDSHYVFICNFAGLNTKELNTPEKWATWLCGCYYTFTCLCPDLESIRRGAVLMAECEDYDWVRNLDVKSYQRLWSELAVAYPIRYQKIKHFHSGLFFNLVFSMTKRLLPAHIRATIEVGCDFDGRLDDVYLTPTVEIANQRLLGQFQELLRRRYHNEKAFTL